MQPDRLQQDDSDDEEDADYVPPAEETRRKQSAVTPPDKETEEDEETKQKKRAALWAEFQSSLSASNAQVALPPSVKTVKIEKRYRFAGEEVVEVNEVPEDSDEAKKWPRWRPPSPTDCEPIPPSSKASGIASPTADQPSPSTSTLTTAAIQSTPSQKPAKRPGPRKPKTQLAPLPGTQKAKKLTTLDKSAMDWRAHVETEGPSTGLKDELDANRRGGGYLEKVEFLQRVEQRKEEALDASRATKRRRTLG